MMIHVNGCQTNVPSDVRTMEQLMHYYELQAKSMIVELNKAIVNKDKYASTSLQNGDCIEFVHFVGGG
ncbi:sulfur carrier protein ThiS [Pontibacillus litoralis]|uniref:Sulfur carrier protein ThiS n=1 Tax=Pontibacillus litoralis JSM 072002 TaxID=1385512 RepID=A0A0A5G1Q5_9BACI|nr:sulfur carrier protein ThiS [Pontibacillus litoralis]KGX84985.1 hypothetical protein N784_11460 [Pontibacillus litoralis JSM 072002]